VKRIRHALSDFRRQLALIGRDDDHSAVQRLFWLLREPKHRPGVTTWRNRPLRYADAPAVYYQLADIYAERIYDFCSDRPDPRILDVGGHIGLASLRFRELFPRARLTTFEPDPVIVALLRANLAAAGDASAEVIAAAAWISDGTCNFSATGDDSGALDTAGVLRVATVDLARFCAEPVDYLKLDIEGAEFDLLAHLRATGALTRVRRLCVELHEWRSGPPRFHEALGHLVAAGFNYRLRSAGVHGAASQPAGFATLAHPANLVAVYAWRD
jgi:FkbM family methyltransferase